MAAALIDRPMYTCIECLGRGKIEGDNAASYYRFKEDNMRAHPSRRQILDNALASSSRRDLVMRITEAPSGIAAASISFSDIR